MAVVETVVNWTIRRITRLICRVHGEQLARFPEQGPLIVVGNHVNFLEVPLMITHLLPRRMTGFAKAETWRNPLLGRLFDMWGAIPLERGEADLKAIRRALAALEEGLILAVAPEGTRSQDGCLRRGHPGVVMLAQRSGAPLLPVAYWGAERYRDNLRRLRRTDFHIAVGRPFRLDTRGVRLTPAVRQQIVDEMMLQLAALLPEQYRGYYAGLEISPPQTAKAGYLRSLPETAEPRTPSA
jgi:1-acyl-sn-glycerol-3-phosphate acyltransferase